MAIIMSNPTDWRSSLGVFIMHYAATEVEFKIILGAIMDLSIYEVSVLAEPYTSQSLRNVFKSIVKMKLSPDDPNREALIGLMGRFKSFSRLRNHIAHSKWTRGERPNSFKPIFASIREEKAKFIGMDPDERDWTTAEMIAETNALEKLFDDVVQFKHQSGFNDIIEKNMSRERH